MNHTTDDLRIDAIQELISPESLLEELPTTQNAVSTVYETRQQLRDIIIGEDDRLVVVVGPCSIHDVDAALEYARRLSRMRSQLKDDLLIIMRVYFEKPRTTIGWKGLINDPNLDDSFDINKGLRLARKLLLQLAEEGIPVGVEFLDMITPQYIADLVSWGAIGARTTESQVHRELVSGMSCPIGFKNGTGGSLKLAVDAVNAAHHSHHFLSVTKQGQTAIFTTSGNPDTHLIMRGGSHGPNYDRDSLAEASSQLQAGGLKPRIMVDFSHANSQKKHEKQLEVGEDIAQQIAAGNLDLMGVMIESHLNEGNQKLISGEPLAYGVSITDSCLGWNDTQPLLEKLATAVAQRRHQNRP